MQNAMLCQYFWHLLVDMRSAQRESRQAFQVSSGCLFKYYQMWQTVPKHADRPKDWSSESRRMHKWLTQSSPRQYADLASHTSNRQWSSRGLFSDFRSQCCAQVHNRGAPEISDVPTGSVSIWRYPCSIMWRRYVNDLQSNYHHQAQNRLERAAFAGHWLVGMIRFSSFPVDASNDDLSMFSFAG